MEFLILPVIKRLQLFFENELKFYFYSIPEPPPRTRQIFYVSYPKDLTNEKISSPWARCPIRIIIYISCPKCEKDRGVRDLQDLYEVTEISKLH